MSPVEMPSPVITVPSSPPTFTSLEKLPLPVVIPSPVITVPSSPPTFTSLEKLPLPVVIPSPVIVVLFSLSFSPTTIWPALISPPTVTLPLIPVCPSLVSGTTGRMLLLSPAAVPPSPVPVPVPAPGLML